MEQNSDQHLNQDSLQSHPIIFFDGVCGLCNQSVNFILNRDGKGKFRFAPLQGETAKGCLSPKNYENLNSLVYLNERGEFYKSSAVVRLLLNLGGIWFLIGILLWIIPKPIRDFFYFLISKIRYRIFGKLEACRMPKPEEKNRFLP